MNNPLRQSQGEIFQAPPPVRQSIRIEPDALTSSTMAAVQNFFETETNHRPSGHMLAALCAIPATINRLVAGTAAPAFHVCRLDTGVGKSVTLAMTLRELRRHFGLDLGVVLCVGRYIQIESMVKTMALKETDYAVLVAEGRPEGSWGLGAQRINSAPLLLTTHAMIQSRLNRRDLPRSKLGFYYPPGDPQKPKPWASAEEFFYKGRPRMLRVWDEAISPGVEVLISKGDLWRMLAAFDRIPAISNVLEDLAFSLRSTRPGEALMIPDMQEIMELQEVYGKLGMNAREDLAETIRTLWGMSNRLARVANDGPKAGNTALSYNNTLPDDMKPMLVLDASARVRETYKLQAGARRDIVFLRDAPKRYDRVKVHYRQGPAGKERLGKAFDKVLEDVGQVINDNPGRKVLVLHHKTDKRSGVRNVPTELPNYVRDPARVRYCSWGQHNATNDFVDCDLVITASILHAPASTVEARARIASDTGTEVPLGDEIRRAVARGEVLHDLLQGLSRGSLRQCDGDYARECDVYLVAARASGVKAALGTLFPGAQLLHGWGPQPERLERAGKLTGRQPEVLKYIEDNASVTFPEVYKALGMDKSNFNRLVTKPHVAKALEDRGILIMGGSPRRFEKQAAMVA